MSILPTNQMEKIFFNSYDESPFASSFMFDLFYLRNMTTITVDIL